MASNVSNSAMETAQDHHLQMRRWADLPKDALFCIIRYVDMKVDLPRVRGVCTSWRSSLPFAELPMFEPHIRVPSLEDGTNLPLFLLESRFYFISPLPSSTSASNCGWIARMCETGTNKWHLLNPLKNDHSHFEHDIDYFYTDPPITGEINLLDFQVLELGRSMSLVHEVDYNNAKDLSKKVVGGWDFTSTHLFAALVLLDQEKDGCENGLLFWRLGDRQWLKVVAEENSSLHIHDIAFHNGKFYIFEVISSFRCGVRVLNPENSSLSGSFVNCPEFFLPTPDGLTLVVDGLPYIPWGGLYLVPSKVNNCLYLVVDGVSCEWNTSNGNITRNTFVFLVKEDDSKWELMENLRDELLFVGYYLTFALPYSSQNLPQWKPNSICSFSYRRTIYHDIYRANQGDDSWMPEGVECLKIVNYPSYNRYLSLFIMQEKEKGTLLFNELCDEDEKLYTGLFFPPPAWVKWHCPSLNNVEVGLHGLGFRDPDAEWPGDASPASY